jgi:hypothetical protein
LDHLFSAEPWVFKDPRLCVLLPFWRNVVKDDVAALFVIRHPVEVARSLLQRNGIPEVDGRAIWEYQFKRAINDLAGMKVLVTTYEVALREPRSWCNMTERWLADVGIDTCSSHDQADRHLNAAFQRQISASADDNLLSRSQRDLLDLLLSARGIHESWQV